MPRARETTALPRLLSISKVAEMTGYSAARVYELARAGHFSTFQRRAGCKILIPEESVRDFLDRGHREARVA